MQFEEAPGNITNIPPSPPQTTLLSENETLHRFLLYILLSFSLIKEITATENTLKCILLCNEF